MYPQRCVLSVMTVIAALGVISARPSKRDDTSKYLANDTLLGKTVPCTDAEKECLQYNRLFYKKTGRCYPMGYGPRGCRFFVDKREFELGEGHLQGICLSKEQCEKEDGDFRMAYDGTCLKYHEIFKVCSRNRGLEFGSHFFGGTECVGVDYYAETPSYVPQPEESGQCVFPNLRHDLTSIQAMEMRKYGLTCDADQSKCFQKGMVWYEALRTCLTLFEQGPCLKGQHLILKLVETSGQKRGATTKCAAVNPCKSNQRMMAFDGKCHDAALIRMVLCPTGVLLTNAFGQMSCTGLKDMYKHVVMLESAREGRCEIVHKVSHMLAGPGVKVDPDCSLTDSGVCSRAVNDMLRSKPDSSVFNEVDKPE